MFLLLSVSNVFLGIILVKSLKVRIVITAVIQVFLAFDVIALHLSAEKFDRDTIIRFVMVMTYWFVLSPIMVSIILRVFYLNIDTQF